MIFRMAAKWPKEKFIKYAKYTTAWPMAKFLQNDLPDRPEEFEQNPLWSGAIKRFLKTRIVARSLKNSRLFSGILQGVKRACEQVPEDFVVEAMVKHRRALTEEPKGIEPVSMVPYYRKFFELFHHVEPKLHEATSSASFESVRSEGGARGWIQGGFMLPDYNQDLTDEGLVTMVETRPGKVQSVHGPVLRETFDELIDRALKEPISVRVQAILEPLKVRLITKGNTLRYWLSRDYQKQLWRYLQKYPQFALTGRPLMASDLHSLIQREQKLGLSFDKWVSGDYAAATDTIDIRHTKAAFESSLKSNLTVRYHKDGTSCIWEDNIGILKPKYKEVLRSVLYEQDILYPENLRRQFGGLEPADQRTGQLMGSTLSFPILCTINLCAYWSALEERFGRKFRIQDLPVLVNGDDILFRCDDQLYQIWLRKTSEVGFSLSLGKNYVHEDYLTVNSQLYFHDKKRDMFIHQGVLNAGLLTGQSKVTGRTGAKAAPVWDYFNEVVTGAVDPVRAKRRFIHYHRKTIENLTMKGKFNVFAAFMKGGLGFKPVDEPRFTAFQRRFADFMDFQLRDDPENFQKIALVKTRPTTIPGFHHNPKFIVQPIYGPYEKGVIDMKDTTVNLPILSTRLELDDETDLKSRLRVRFPKSSIMQIFRSRNWRQQKGGIVKSRFRLMEFIGPGPTGPERPKQPLRPHWVQRLKSPKTVCSSYPSESDWIESD